MATGSRFWEFSNWDARSLWNVIVLKSTWASMESLLIGCYTRMADTWKTSDTWKWKFHQSQEPDKLTKRKARNLGEREMQDVQGQLGSEERKAKWNRVEENATFSIQLFLARLPHCITIDYFLFYFHVIRVYLLSQSASEKHSQEKKAHKPLRTSWISPKMYLPCLIITQSCYFDYRMNTPLAYSRCVIFVSCCVHLILTYYARKGS